VKRSAKKPAGYTQAQLANEIGCSRSTVQRAIEIGQISPGPGGRFSKADAETIRVGRKAKQEAKDQVSNLEEQLLQARLRERRAISKLRELELERESGRFVELAQVQRAGADAAQRILAVLRAMPQRVALEVDGALVAPVDRRAAAVERIISVEVERAVSELRRSVHFHVPSE